jgi:hypothetical protein
VVTSALDGYLQCKTIMKISNNFLQNVDNHIPDYTKEITTLQSKSHQALNVKIRESADSCGGTLIKLSTYRIGNG